MVHQVRKVARVDGGRTSVEPTGLSRLCLAIQADQGLVYVDRGPLPSGEYQHRLGRGGGVIIIQTLPVGHCGHQLVVLQGVLHSVSSGDILI